MNVVHLTSSPFYGGPERQILGLSVHLDRSIRTTVLCFRERLSAMPFVERLQEAGVDARLLEHENPDNRGMIRDVVGVLRSGRADLLICHGYKADVIGFLAARVARVPVISVSRGWTGHTRKVRLNEALDRVLLRFMRTVICVSEGQAAKVRRAGVPARRVRVIRNAIDLSRFDEIDAAAGRATLQAMFATPRELLIVGAGRLSPEKGFEVFVDMAREVAKARAGVGFVLFGDGPERAALEQRVREHGLEGQVVFAGFRADVDRLMPGADLMVQSSHTEGLPNVVLEACAAGVAVVATDVGGTGEVIADGVNGLLVRPGDAAVLATRVLALLGDDERRRAMGDAGRVRVRADFSFATQSAEYEQLFATLVGKGPAVREAARTPALVATGA